MRIGSRQDPLLAALLAAADAGALTLPASMTEGRARLASLRAVVAAQTPPLAEQSARAAAVLALMADPAEDVVGAVLAARAADDEHRLRADLLGEAVDLAATADVLPDGWGTLLLDAHARCTAQLRGAYATFSPVSTRPDDLWAASPAVRGAWTSFTRGALHYEAIMTVHRLTRATSPAELDTENLFYEIRNTEHVWPERITSLRPLSTLVPPWPPRSDTLAWLLWVHGAGGVLHLPTVAEQDAAWNVVFGERARVFGAGDRHVREMRETFG